MDAIMSLLQDFDPAAFIPELNTVLGWIELLARLSVMTGPLLLLALGLLSFLAPPKEANHKLGFRALFGMGSVEAWQYTQKTAGFVWTSLGAILTVAMAFICNGYRDMAWEAMLLSALISVIVELLLVFVSKLLINALVVLRFDLKGSLRRESK